MKAFHLLRAGALALACFAVKPVSASPLIFGFSDVDLRPVQAAQSAARRALRPHHNHIRVIQRDPDAPGLEGWESSSLLNVARSYLGRRNFTGFEEAWCADALRVWLRQSGHSLGGTDHRAISFARYGRPSTPHVGAVAVLRHHVGIVAGFTHGGVILLSGNHRQRVGFGVYSPRRILAFREPI